eukprot:TRINITY_DN14659_c0_g1_i1.p1 TRINITY_DN14659_c0_g1~~TRINITY_DN14659_c0_g1_i1.p1  ORF type:complete len:287 (-),score=149.31 TRINITY_DN14659_c0_g1_i1:44-880(-)
MGNVPTDEMYIYKYFHEKLERKGEKIDDDAGSVTSEEFNNYLDKMGGRANDFDGEDMDFAGGLGEEESKKEEDSDDEDSDGEAPEMEAMDASDEEEPTGLDGEDDDDFKDLSSGDEDAEMDIMAGGDDDDDLDEEGFGADDDDFDEEGFGGDDDMDEEGFGEDDQDEDKSVSKIKVKPENKDEILSLTPIICSSLLSDAEEFAHLLDENEDDGMTTSVSNKDKASKKQLNWEDNRENYMKGGQSWKNKSKGKKTGGVANKNFESKPSLKKPPKKKSKK